MFQEQMDHVNNKPRQFFYKLNAVDTAGENFDVMDKTDCTVNFFISSSVGFFFFNVLCYAELFKQHCEYAARNSSEKLHQANGIKLFFLEIQN
jgi:hypothetical protein